MSPTSNGQTGDVFSVNCSSGYTASPAATGNMTCDANNIWVNNVSCIVNTCNGTHTIPNSVSVSPASDGQSNDKFSVNCSSGYTASPGPTGNMTCDENNNWANIVSCIGK